MLVTTVVTHCTAKESFWTLLPLLGVCIAKKASHHSLLRCPLRNMSHLMTDWLVKASITIGGTVGWIGMAGQVCMDTHCWSRDVIISRSGGGVEVWRD
jgi:hypothetical protein